MSLSQVGDLAPAEYPGAPRPDAIKGTLLNIVDIQEGTGRARVPGGIGLFPSFGCIETGFALGALCGATAGSKFDNAQNPQWQDGLGFGAYGLVVCKLEDQAMLHDGVERSYDLAESRVIEAAIMAGLFVEQTASGTQGGWAAADDITPTPGTAVDPVLGLGLLESDAAAKYAGQYIIHMPRVIAILLSKRGVLTMTDGVLYTSLGTPVAAGPGYDLPNTGPDGDEADDGTKWIYATGAVQVVRQKIDVRDWFNYLSQQNDDQAPNYVAGLDPNMQGALDERAYLASIDCYKAAVLVTTEP